MGINELAHAKPLKQHLELASTQLGLGGTHLTSAVGGTALRKGKLTHEGSIRKGEKRLRDRAEKEWREGMGKGNAVKM